jgi:hypothetical protein
MSIGGAKNIAIIHASITAYTDASMYMSIVEEKISP